MWFSVCVCVFVCVCSLMSPWLTFTEYLNVFARLSFQCIFSDLFLVSCINSLHSFDFEEVRKIVVNTLKKCRGIGFDFSSHR